MDGALTEQGGQGAVAATPTRSGARRAGTDLAFAVLLAVCIGAAYAPSLRHAPRADQWCFLVDTIHQHDFLGILHHSYSYNRTRHVCPGDTDLFRPLLFLLLSAEKALFDTDLKAPQVVGMVLHGIVCFLLMVLLRRMAAAPPDQAAATRPRFSAAALIPYGVALFFALNWSVQELVIWTHLQGYVLFLVFLLGSWILLLRGAASVEQAGGWTNPALRGSWLLALLAAFTYEMGQLYALLAGLFLAAAVVPKLGRRRALGLFAAFAGVLVLYQGANQADRLLHRGHYRNEHIQSVMLERAFTTNTLWHTGRFAVYTALQPFFPHQEQASFEGGRLIIQESAWNGGRGSLGGPTAALSWLVIGLALVFGGWGAVRLARRSDRTPLLAWLLAAGLCGLYAGITVLGRMNVRPGPSVLSTNSYYAYPGLLFALAFGAAACLAFDRKGAWAEGCRYALLVGLGVLTLWSAASVRRVNVEIAGDLQALRRPIQALRQFVERHRGEPDFSLAIDDGASDPVPSFYGASVTNILFDRWMAARPKYVVTLRQGKLTARRGEDGRDAPVSGTPGVSR